MIEFLLRFSENSGILAFMNSQWGWPIAESIHFLGLSLLIGTVGLFDLRMMGFVRDISLEQLHKLVPFGVLGYLLNLITGIMFLSSAPDQYLYNPALQSKVVLMLLAGMNMLLFYTTTARELKSPATGRQTLARAKMMAAVSLGCWCGIIICGRLITYFRPPYHWCVWC